MGQIQPLIINYEDILHENDGIALQTTRDAIGGSMNEVGHMYPRGSFETAALSCLPEGVAEKIENRLADARTELRQEYFLLLSYRGGQEAADIARRLLAQTVGKDPSADGDCFEEYAAAISILEKVGGPAALHTLLAMRDYPHPQKNWNSLAAYAAERLYRNGTPHDWDDPAFGAPDELSEEQWRRTKEFRERYPSQPAPVPGE